jgi:integrase
MTPAHIAKLTLEETKARIAIYEKSLENIRQQRPDQVLAAEKKMDQVLASYRVHAGNLMREMSKKAVTEKKNAREEGRPVKSKTASKSKKHDMARLPDDWRARAFAGTLSQRPDQPSQTRKAVALLWLTGCRPSEVQKGVVVRMQDGELVIEITGSKTDTIPTLLGGDVDRGLGLRTVYVDPALNAGAVFLAGLAAAGPITITHNAASLRTRINEIGHNILSRMKRPPSLSPYSFRHAMGCDLKSCDSLDDETRSTAMGHGSTESLESYGRRRRGGSAGPAPILRAVATIQPHTPGNALRHRNAPAEADTSITRPKC